MTFEEFTEYLKTLTDAERAVVQQVIDQMARCVNDLTDRLYAGELL